MPIGICPGRDRARGTGGGTCSLMRLMSGWGRTALFTGYAGLGRITHPTPPVTGRRLRVPVSSAASALPRGVSAAVAATEDMHGFAPAMPIPSGEIAEVGGLVWGRSPCHSQSRCCTGS
jgi:hypothetical protein